MSPSNINSFVGDLVQMAKAMETLPQVEAENERLNGMVESYAKQVQALELRAIDRNAEISTLHDRIRSLEVERDDASFRVLEAEDKAHHVLNWVRDTQALMGQVIGELDPPKPEPVKEDMVALGEEIALNYPGSPPQAQPVATPVEGSQSVENPSVPNPVGDGNHTGDASTMIAEKRSDVALSPISDTSGQSESSPTSATMGNISATQDVLNVPEAQAVSSTEPTHGPYFGKRYQDVQGFVSYTDWINGGGTDKDYDLPS